MTYALVYRLAEIFTLFMPDEALRKTLKKSVDSMLPWFMLLFVH